VKFARRLARGRSEATPARLLLGTVAVIAVVVAIVVVLVFAIQAVV
jgi:hypothetical protein